MAIKTQVLTRQFIYQQLKLTDPGAQYSPEQVKEFYSAIYPELATASIDPPETKGNTVKYVFRKPVAKTKG